MSSTLNEQKDRPEVQTKGLARSLFLNIAVPLLLFFTCENYLHTSELVALSIASISPICDSIFELIRYRQLDFIAAVVLIGTFASIIGVILGGSAKLLLIRESFFTGALGVACFVSFLFPRPLMFYVGKQMSAGKDPARRAAFDDQWKKPYARFAHRLITLVWGIVFVGEFILRVIIVYTLPTAIAITVTPVIITAAIIGTLFWTFAFVRQAKQHTQENQQNILAVRKAR
jgi:hypothetical protein